MRWLLVLVLLVTSVPGALASAQGESSEFGMVVSTPELVVRSCADPGCDGLITLHLGAMLEVTGEEENGYYPVRSGSTEGYAWSLFIATPSAGTPVLREGHAGCDRIAFVFNLGRGDFSDPFSWAMIDYLKAESIPATMFIRAWWAGYYPAWAYDFDQSGFALGILGEPGLSLGDQSAEAVMNSVIETQSLLYEAIGHNGEPLFAPFDADADPALLSMLAMAGYLPVIAGVSAQDGHDSGASADTVAANILDGAHDGAIIELHLDTYTGATATVAALPGVIATLRERGYTFVTIPELAQPCAAR